MGPAVLSFVSRPLANNGPIRLGSLLPCRRRALRWQSALIIVLTQHPDIVQAGNRRSGAFGKPPARSLDCTGRKALDHICSNGERRIGSETGGLSPDPIPSAGAENSVDWPGNCLLYLTAIRPRRCDPSLVRSPDGLPVAGPSYDHVLPQGFPARHPQLAGTGSLTRVEHRVTCYPPLQPAT